MQHNKDSEAIKTPKKEARPVVGSTQGPKVNLSSLSQKSNSDIDLWRKNHDNQVIKISQFIINNHFETFQSLNFNIETPNGKNHTLNTFLN